MCGKGREAESDCKSDAVVICREVVDEVVEEVVLGRPVETTEWGGRALYPRVLGGGDIAVISAEGRDRSFLFLDFSLSAGSGSSAVC